MVESVKKRNQIKIIIQDKPERIEVVDIPQIIELYKSLWGRAHLFKPAEFKKVIKQKLSYSYKKEKESCLCNKEKELIACCLMEYDKKEDYVEIDLLIVKKDYQGFHLGKSLLSFCLNNCCNLNLKKFRLHVSDNNLPAINLYKKLGFTIKEFIVNYYNEEQKDKDAYCMILDMS